MSLIFPEKRDIDSPEKEQFYGVTVSNGWHVVYKRAVEPDGTLLFPRKLSVHFLERAHRTMGSYFYANQYLNQVIPDDQKRFRPEWIRYYKEVPRGTYTFVLVDPAMSETEHADFTGVVIFDVDTMGTRYVRYAQRLRVTPTELISLLFDINERYKPMTIAIETVAFQKALLYFLQLEMKRRKTVLPIAEVKIDINQTKEMRILGLVPWIQWGRMLFAQGLADLELELTTFPRGAHDDIIDALAHGDQIAITPSMEVVNVRPHAADANAYEQWYRNEIAQGRRQVQRSDPEE